jgi:hypothetical protein
MRSAITKIALRKAVGLYLGEREIAISKVAATLLGPVETAASIAPCTPENWAEVVEQQLTPLLGRKRRVPVAVGLTCSRLFFGTRLTAAGGAGTAEIELQRALCSSNLCADDLVADMLPGVMNKQPIVRIAACRKKYMAGVVAMLTKLGVRPLRAEPAPCALVRLAQQQNSLPRRAKTIVHVFLGAGQGLAAVVSGGAPFAWRTFPLAAGSEGVSILSAVRSLETQQRHYGVEITPEYIVIHGRDDLHERLRQEQIPSEMGRRMIWHPGPEFNGANEATGLALGCLAQGIKAFDLSRTMKSRATIKEIFPWADLAFTSAMVACMGVVLSSHSMKLGETYATLRAENSGHACLGSAKPSQLEKEKKSLDEQIDAMRTFLSSRITWSAYCQDIAAHLPPQAVLGVFNGKNSMATGKKKGGGSLQVQGTASLTPNGSIPREIDAFLRGTADRPLWKRGFTSVATDIKLPLAETKDKKAPPEVNFIITCARKDGAANTPKGGAKGKKAKS